MVFKILRTRVSFENVYRTKHNPNFVLVNADKLTQNCTAIFLGKSLNTVLSVMQGDAGEYLEQPAVQVKIRETRRKLGTAQSTITSILI
jgi:hypothetical protein